MKPIVTTHTNPLLENFKALDAQKLEGYTGFIYLWKCIPENLYYIGAHQGVTNDTYRGSGKRFRQVFEHYGITQFERVVLEYVTDNTTIRTREQYWIDKFNAVRSSSFLNENNSKL